MDPNANLREQRELAKRLLDHDREDDDDVWRLCELIEALDEWLSKGGYLPQDWQSLGQRLGFQPINSRTHGYNRQEHR